MFSVLWGLELSKKCLFFALCATILLGRRILKKMGCSRGSPSYLLPLINLSQFWLRTFLLLGILWLSDLRLSSRLLFSLSGPTAQPVVVGMALLQTLRVTPSSYSFSTGHRSSIQDHGWRSFFPTEKVFFPFWNHSFLFLWRFYQDLTA